MLHADKADLPTWGMKKQPILKSIATRNFSIACTICVGFFLALALFTKTIMSIEVTDCYMGPHTAEYELAEMCHE